MVDGRALIGVGIYTPAEAGRLIRTAAPKISRWLRGHDANGRHYEPLWDPEIDIGDERLYLSFRDLLEARVAATFIALGLSPQRVRQAILLAQDVVGPRPLSTTWLKTDGRSVFLQVAEETQFEPVLIDLFTSQYEFNSIVEKSFRDVDFEGPLPKVWWPMGRRSGILIDPQRSFGQPIEATTSIPTAKLAAAAKSEGSIARAARAWGVSRSAIRRGVAFEDQLQAKKAA